MEKHTQARGLAEPALSFPGSKKENVCWESEVITQLYFLLTADSACPATTTHPSRTDSLSAIPRFPDCALTDAISSEIPASLLELGHRARLQQP